MDHLTRAYLERCIEEARERHYLMHPPTPAAEEHRAEVVRRIVRESFDKHFTSTAERR